MRGADLIGANLFGAEFYFAILTGADLTGADLEAARFVIRQFGQILIFMEPLCQLVITKLGLKSKVLSSKKLSPNYPASLLLGGLALGLVAPEGSINTNCIA